MTDEILGEYRSWEPMSEDRWRLKPEGLNGEVLEDDNQDSDKDSDDSDSLWSDGSENPVLHIGSLEKIEHVSDISLWSLRADNGNHAVRDTL